jgi:hypothetical protein
MMIRRPDGSKWTSGEAMCGVVISESHIMRKFDARRPEPGFIERELAGVAFGASVRDLSQERDRWFESGSLQRGVCEPSVPSPKARAFENVMMGSPR